MNPTAKPKPGAIATRRGRPAWQYPLVRHKPPMTNREWQESRQRARKAGFFEALFARLLRRVK